MVKMPRKLTKFCLTIEAFHFWAGYNGPPLYPFSGPFARFILLLGKDFLTFWPFLAIFWDLLCAKSIFWSYFRRRGTFCPDSAEKRPNFASIVGCFRPEARYNGPSLYPAQKWNASKVGSPKGQGGLPAHNYPSKMPRYSKWVIRSWDIAFDHGKSGIMDH